ncbi:protease modulator HflC [Novispirillum sp. DQ9]|uniref:protease modulator HflC n=1 Tax=Novispirillum sp. DQ9 TaxID=3398612 RepID=UPI003C7C950B
MKRTSLAIVGVVAAVAAVLLGSSLFTVHQTQQAIVLQFGNPVDVIQEPGLHFKVPFVQNVVFYEKRILSLNPPSQEVPLIDQKRIIVDSFLRYQIVQPLEFYKTVRNEIALRDRFGAILNSVVRDTLGESDLQDLLTDKRGEVMRSITDTVRRRSAEFGINVVDVRIGRTDLPDETSQSVYNRMRSSRIAEAAQLRAQGEELKARIQAEADRDRTLILAEAERKAQVMRGEGDAQRNTILGEAYGRDPEFFRFYRSMEAYREALGTDTTLVLSPNSEFFRYFNQSPQGAGSGRGANPAGNAQR